MFNPNRLNQARLRRRLTGKALAERAGLAQDTVSRLERGLHDPEEGSVAALAAALDYPEDYFYLGDPVDLDADSVSFRSLSKMSVKERDAACSAGSLGLQLCQWVEERFALPGPDLPDLSYETDPEAAAVALRQHWGLGQKPIGNMIGLLEVNGIRVLSLAENTAQVNAFSFWRDDRAYIFLNNFKTPESSIFDSAHELGHLVLHRHAGTRVDRNAEREADAFAAHFLMPRHDVLARVMRPVTVDVVLKAKGRWRVSAMAMAYHLRTLERLSDYQYKSLVIEMSRRGYRSGEPLGIERESSIIWRKVLAQLWSEKVTRADIARELSLPLDEIQSLLWGLTVGPTERVDPNEKTQLASI
ncbi:MAG: ImmA/IrrE family metallo-endopeptidase [Pseudomonadota bacterium]|jgi:Zn-dependent peptidase ImmA (M78 family)/DNA-binding XRE family transcriptional regulator